MKLTRDRRIQFVLFLYRSLIICLILLGSIVVGGTIYSVVQNKNGTDHSWVTFQKVGEGQTFTGIGQIRIPTADPKPGLVILLVVFTYYPDDKAFSEELVLRVRDFRQIITDYFSSFSVEELNRLNADGLEDKLKEELLQRFNAILRLGQIETLYFGDFMVLR